MPLSETVRTTLIKDGREFVNPEDFLNCYLNKDEKARELILRALNEFEGQVEKRIDEPLVKRLYEICWEADPIWGATESPIVFEDGWVIWVPKPRHEGFIDSLGLLFKKRDRSAKTIGSISDVLDQLERKKPVSGVRGVGSNVNLLTYGHAWYISTARPRCARMGRAYKPTLEDEAIFQTFQVDYID